MEIKDLKVRAYDLLALIDQARAELRQVNDLIVREANNGLRKSTVEPPKREPEAKEKEPGVKPFTKD